MHKAVKSKPVLRITRSTSVLANTGARSEVRQIEQKPFLEDDSLHKKTRSEGISILNSPKKSRMDKSQAVLKVTFLLGILVILSILRARVDRIGAGLVSTLLATVRPRTICQPRDFSCKVDEAFATFKRLEQRQSQSVVEAVAEYKRRYKRLPPPGFENWAATALSYNVALIDEYGQLEADLLPFRSLPPKQLHALVESAIEANGRVTEKRRLGTLKVQDGFLQVEGYSFRELSNETLYQIIEPFVHRLPNLIALINWFPQPRVMDSSVSDDYHGKSEKDAGSMFAQQHMSESVRFEDRSGRENWDYLRASCPSNHLTTSELAAGRSDIDICQWNEDMKEHHGLFVAPSAFFPTRNAVPIISRGKVSTMLDILGPNPCYFTDRYRLWSFPDETPFDEKKWSVYWRGQTTGIALSMGSLYTSQRLRFATLVQWLSRWLDLRDADHSSQRTGTRSDSRQNGTLWTAWSKAEKNRKEAKMTIDIDALDSIGKLHSKLFDVAFDRIFSVDSRQTEDLVMSTYPFEPSDYPQMMYQHQFLPDIDGESMSCRFYAQLGSGSVPIKQTIFAEWHDDRIVPWLHYIPLSTSYEEFPALLAWFLTPSGRARLLQISQAGQMWAPRALRKIDISLYYYRLLLEYAHLFRDRDVVHTEEHNPHSGI